jgi:hypothetical protein
MQTSQGLCKVRQLTFIIYFQETRSLTVKVVRTALGGTRRKVGWGQEENKPEWWPAHVAWTKRGVQSGVHHKELREIITACYKHHGQSLYVSYTFCIIVRQFNEAQNWDGSYY